MVAFGAAIECGALFIINQEKRVASFTGATNHHAGSSRAICACVCVCVCVCVCMCVRAHARRRGCVGG